MFKIALLLLINLQSIPELIRDQYIAFQKGEYFYLVDSEKIYKTKNGKTFEEIKHHTVFPHFNFDYMNINSETFLISKGIGLVYSFEDYTFKRLDHSFDHRNKYQSSLFEFKEEIYAFGGYGLFNDTNNLIYFDNDVKEWFEFDYFSAENHPEPRRYAIAGIKESSLYVFGGFRENIDSQLKVSTKFLHDVWVLDLNSHSWKQLGKTTISDLLEPDLELRFVKIIPYKGNHLIMSKQNCLLIDIKNNKIQKFDGFNSKLAFGASSISYNPMSNQFMVVSNNHINGKEKPVFFTEQDFLSNNTKTYDLLTATKPLYKFFAFGGFISLIVVCIFLRKPEKTKDKILKNIDAIRKELNENENTILDELLKTKNEGLENPYILNFYEPTMSYESKSKKLRSSLKNMNEVISKNIGSKKDVIVKENSKHDKRIRIVKIA